MPLADDRYFGPDSQQRAAAMELFASVEDLPLVCPHGHVDPRMFADEDFSFGTPTEMIVIPDHYIFRMLYSQGIALESLGIPAQDGTPVETDHRKIWQRFADHFHLFHGTPTGMWLDYELKKVFGVDQKLNDDNAQAIYDHIESQLARPEFRPRALYEQFNVEVLCTTDAATDTLEHHRQIRGSGWYGRILPTFRPDGVINVDAGGWRTNIDRLSETSGTEVKDYASLVHALEQRRAYFKEMGAVATDHAAMTAHTGRLTPAEANTLFQRALAGHASQNDALRFTGHMLIEMARMSFEDGLVMQLHVGSYRSHNPLVSARFGPDKGADIPIQGEFTRALKPLLDEFGSERRFRLVLFTLDETTYARELAPLAGHYPVVVLGPPWWFHDSLNGINRFLDQVMETAGVYNTAGFNDDTRAFPSIPARHDLWRRACCNWLARLVVTRVLDMEDALPMAHALAYGQAKRTYNL